MDSKAQIKHDAIADYFLKCKSVKETAKNFKKQPEQIRRILARKGIDPVKIRAEYFAVEPKIWGI
jgi:hypothetical protein